MYYPTLDAHKDMVRRCGDDMPYDMAYHVKLVAKMFTGNKELSNELDRRQDGHATLAVARILSGVHKALKGGTAMVWSLVSASAGQMAEMTRYMSQVDFVFSQNPAIVAAYRPRERLQNGMQRSPNANSTRFRSPQHSPNPAQQFTQPNGTPNRTPNPTYLFLQLQLRPNVNGTLGPGRNVPGSSSAHGVLERCGRAARADVAAG